MEFERTIQEFEEYTQGLALREDPDNGSYEHALMIEEFQKSEYTRLNEVFKDEYKNYINNDTYFYGCPFDIYSRTYNQRLESYITCVEEEYNFIDYKTAEIVFIENELKEDFPQSPYLFIDDNLKIIIEKSLFYRDGFLKEKLASLNNDNTDKVQEKEFPAYCHIGSLFAQGFIRKEGGNYYFNDIKFDSVREIAKHINTNVFTSPIKSIIQYIRDTTSHPIKSKGGNNFYQSKGMMKKIIAFCNHNKIKVSDDFQAKYISLDN